MDVGEQGASRGSDKAGSVGKGDSGVWPQTPFFLPLPLSAPSKHDLHPQDSPAGTGAAPVGRPAGLLSDLPGGLFWSQAGASVFREVAAELWVRGGQEF